MIDQKHDTGDLVNITSKNLDIADEVDFSKELFEK